MAKSIFIYLIILGCIQVTFAQKPKYDTVFIEEAIRSAYSNYRLGMNEHLALYNGSDHTVYRSASGEHPYFKHDDWQNGFVILNGNKYDDVGLLYNTWTDKLLVDSYRGAYVIQVISEDVQSFGIGNHVFVRLESKTIQRGYYELLFNSAIKVYAKRAKSMQEHISNSKINRSFIERNRYYVFQNGQYFLVKSKKSILQLFSNRKKEINQFLKQNNISFLRNREMAIIRITKFYSEN